MPKENTLIIEHLSKTYDGKHFANQDISLAIQPGRVTALLGHNGAGKSTLLNQIIGFTAPTSGEVLYRGRSLIAHRPEARQLISFMSQQFAPIDLLTIRQSLDIIGRIRGLTATAVEQETEQLIDKLDIADHANKKGQSLSGGLKRLTSFAMAMVGASEIILLDEPTNDVDPMRREKQWQLLRELAEHGHIIVIVTHNLLEVEKYADDYALFNEGQLVSYGPVQQISQEEKYLITFTVHDDQLKTALASAQWLTATQCQQECLAPDLACKLQELETWLAEERISQLQVKPYHATVSDLYRKEAAQWKA